MNRNNLFESLESREMMSFTPLGSIPHTPRHVAPITVPKTSSAPFTPKGTTEGTGVTAPTVFKVQVLSHTQVLLTWAGDTGASTGYTIQRSSNGKTGWNNVGTTAVGGRSFINSGLKAKTEYFYRIVAEGTGGAVAFSGVAEVNTLFA